MNFYKYDEIKQRGDCVQFVTNVLGLDVNRDGRCQATWRGGDGYNVAVKQDEWYDHKERKGGSIIDLCMVAKGMDMYAAQNLLGEWLGLNPKMRKQANPLANRGTRYQRLIDEGYTEAKRYEYRDPDSDTIVHIVARLEHAEKQKEFVQGTSSHWSLAGVKRILYRMADWIGCEGVCIVEGEKDADTMCDVLGIPATTNCGGAEHWEAHYNEYLTGKKVAIIRDNDEAGKKHADRIARELKNVALAIIIVCPSNLPKGDVTDWVETEGGDRAKLIQMLKDAKPVDLETLEDVDPALEEAKQANRWDFCNYILVDKQIGREAKKVKEPRHISKLVQDTHKRFLGFPRRIGDSRWMFDHDRGSGSIIYMRTVADLISWIGRKSKRKVGWCREDLAVTKEEFYSALLSEAITYESVSVVPDWPRRNDVYYAHPKLPEPSADHDVFNGFLEFFNPASDADRTLLKAMICAPLWYMRRIPRPGWVIDSEDGAGTGKTTLVELIAQLYGGPAIRINKQQLRTDVERIVKRFLSPEGRGARIAMFDNITGDFKSEELSDFMTAESISGMAAYGRGEETRPNNLMYVITANSATLDNDLVERCFFIKLQKARRTPGWKRQVDDYIEENRYRIFADIIDMLEKANPMESEPITRFPDFEEQVLWPVCVDAEAYQLAMSSLAEAKASSNLEEEQARIIEDEIRSRLIQLSVQPGSTYIFIQTRVLKKWISEILGHEFESRAAQFIRNLSKNKLTERFDHKKDRHGKDRLRGIMWVPEDATSEEIRVIAMENNTIREIVFA